MSEPERGTVEATESGQGIDPSELSKEDLTELINTGELPEPTPDEQADSQESDEQADADQEAEPETDDAEQPPAADEADDEQAEEVVDPQQARLDEAIARARHFETVAGRLGGKIGFLERQNQQQQQQILQLSQASARDADGFDTQQQMSQPAIQPQPSTDPNAMYLSQQAVSSQFANFAQRNPGIVDPKGPQGVNMEFAQQLASRAEELQMLSQSGNALEAAAQAEQIYSETFSQVLRDRAIRVREDAERRSADQAEALKKKKRAQASAAASAKPATPKRQPRTVKELSKDQLKQLIDSRTGLD
jgi:hypothetical protein